MDKLKRVEEESLTSQSQESVRRKNAKKVQNRSGSSLDNIQVCALNEKRPVNAASKIKVKATTGPSTSQPAFREAVTNEEGEQAH